MGKKRKKVCRVLNYIEHLLISISAFVSLVWISIGITSSAIRVKFYVITAVIKKYKPINKKKGRSMIK